MESLNFVFLCEICMFDRVILFWASNLAQDCQLSTHLLSDSQPTNRPSPYSFIGLSILQKNPKSPSDVNTTMLFYLIAKKLKMY